MPTYDFVVVGGGIVGCSVAWQILQSEPGATVMLVEKEQSFAAHQTGHNSGVIHAGIYYAPGSLKARLCKEGSAATYAFCDEHGIAYERCGKLLVATNEREMERMQALYARGLQAGLDCELVSEAELRRREPRISGQGAIFVRSTGIVNYRQVTAKMAELFTAQGGKVTLGSRVTAIAERAGHVDVRTSTGPLRARQLIVCAGTQADRMARLAGLDVDFAIVPFRGEYYRLPPALNDVTRALIYPIPDPELPFLGIHLTRMIDGSVTVGPNAVLGFAREGYPRFSVDLKDLWELATFPGLWKLLPGQWRNALHEFSNSMSRAGYLEECRKYCPELTVADLQPYPAGIRAQAVSRRGELIHDFLIKKTDRMTHVCNAPSPAATSAIPIGRHILDGLLAREAVPPPAAEAAAGAH
ncbi:L-2-hydroxyglutarate oxidase LhgO [Pigmentiphaga humi]|uniref:L-2-hydroxyglutarate oxidase LhgO n=1 Tax=Pigmentiphaga humi TaxID=2478468 RepID=A0A3P4B6Y9_9BURK|nr:L-2-hydroxyglutarate oxidase [Pigmentiphaga humi]VCU71448.1 L-2-hydroxyglutarate oxidase LhgO [Pigmentiphaga humi]